MMRDDVTKHHCPLVSSVLASMYVLRTVLFLQKYQTSLRAPCLRNRGISKTQKRQ